MEIRTQLELLIKEFANGSQSQFGKIIGASQGTIGTWISRGNMNERRIKAAFPQVDGNWLLTGKGQMLLPENGKSSVQVNGHYNTTQITSSGNINSTKTIDNEDKTSLNEMQLLKQEIASLRALLDEKERLINVLMEHAKGAK